VWNIGSTRAPLTAVMDPGALWPSQSLQPGMHRSFLVPFRMDRAAAFAEWRGLFTAKGTASLP